MWFCSGGTINVTSKRLRFLGLSAPPDKPKIYTFSVTSVSVVKQEDLVSEIYSAQIENSALPPGKGSSPVD
jgi:hypothetical protein